MPWKRQREGGVCFVFRSSGVATKTKMLKKVLRFRLRSRATHCCMYFVHTTMPGTIGSTHFTNVLDTDTPLTHPPPPLPPPTTPLPMANECMLVFYNINLLWKLQNYYG